MQKKFYTNYLPWKARKEFLDSVRILPPCTVLIKELTLCPFLIPLVEWELPDEEDGFLALRMTSYKDLCLE